MRALEILTTAAQQAFSTAVKEFRDLFVCQGTCLKLMLSDFRRVYEK